MTLREAAIDSATFAQSRDARRALAEYREQNQYDAWRNIANVVPLNDFRMQHRTRWGGFGDLPVVAEAGDYIDGTVPDDDEATYKAAKVGRLAHHDGGGAKRRRWSDICQIPTAASACQAHALEVRVRLHPQQPGDLRWQSAVPRRPQQSGHCGTVRRCLVAGRLAMMQQTEAVPALALVDPSALPSGSGGT